MAKRKSSRKEQRRQQEAQKTRKRRLMIGVPLLVILVIVVALAVVRLRPVEGVVALGAQDRGHDVEAAVTSEGLPPVGGAHSPSVQNCGIYETPLISSRAVHALEHGAVWVTYRPDLPPEDISALQDALWDETYVLLSPYESQTEELVLSAWGNQLIADGIDDERVDSFLNRYRGQGPEPGAPCTGGSGTPINR